MKVFSSRFNRTVDQLHLAEMTESYWPKRPTAPDVNFCAVNTVLTFAIKLAKMHTYRDNIIKISCQVKRIEVININLPVYMASACEPAEQ